ncbi:MAG: amidase [Pirellulales bacterium]|nr:amidase [Pirellulales bacterium]
MNPPDTITDAATQLKKGRISPHDLVEQCLAQIEKFDSQIHAWVSVDAAGARRAADELGREAAEGIYRGPLHGIPVGIKDIFDVAGMPTRAGSPLREDAPPAETDAPLVAGLRQAGAIILGKTVTVEFACFDPSPTRNPWNPERSPGGSSSGSAAALAMGMCLGALGTQTGGSLVRPASYCGVCTIKPTFGLLSRDGVVPVSCHLDHTGPMARTVEDLWILLHTLLPSYQKLSSIDKLPSLSTLSSPPRFGLLQKYLDLADPLIREATETAVKKLQSAGARIELVAVPAIFDEVLPMHRTIMAVDAAEFHREQFPAQKEKYGPKINALLEEGLKIPGVDYAAALAWQRRFRQCVETELFNAISPLPLGEGSGVRADENLKYIDSLLLPSTDNTAPGLETTGTPLFQAPWSLSGVPAVSIPCGPAADRMPAGLQLIGRRNQDFQLLEGVLKLN